MLDIRPFGMTSHKFYSLKSRKTMPGILSRNPVNPVAKIRVFEG